VRIDGVGILTMNRFVDAASIDPVFFDTACSNAPDNKAGQDTFFVLRGLLRKTGMSTLSRV
jgi:DNA end-binding protein Ku